MGDNITVAPQTGATLDALATDELTTLNGTDISADSPRVHAQRVKPVFGSDGVAQDVDADNPLPVDAGIILPPDSVKHGSTGASVGLSTGDQLHSLLVIPADGQAITVTVFANPADTLPADLPYSEDFKGLATPEGHDVTITGQVSYWRVTYRAAEDS
jgi:hypothetical protein